MCKCQHNKDRTEYVSITIKWYSSCGPCGLTSETPRDLRVTLEDHWYKEKQSLQEDPMAAPSDYVFPSSPHLPYLTPNLWFPLQLR